MHIGDKKSEGGRLGDHVAKGLSVISSNTVLNLEDLKQNPSETSRDFDKSFHLEKQQEMMFLQSLLFMTLVLDKMFHVGGTRWFHVERETRMPCKIECSVSSTTGETSRYL